MICDAYINKRITRNEWKQLIASNEDFKYKNRKEVAKDFELKLIDRF